MKSTLAFLPTLLGFCIGAKSPTGQRLWYFGRDPNLSVIRRDLESPNDRERLGYVCDVSVHSFRDRG